MVLEYYNLKEQPFGVTPDPRFLYLSESHREALATLSYGIRCRRGFMSLIAKPGMGKTTILFQLLSELKSSARTVFLFQTLCSPKDLLRGLLRDLGVADDDGDPVRMQEDLNRVLLAEAREGRRVIVVIDEAQNLEDSALELVRMLSNFETARYKLMQIILSGQPQLRDKLASPRLLQLRQRMSMFARLHPFSVEETQLYVRHRLRVADYDFKTPLFTPKAEALIAKYSEGIPRNINNICFNALSLGCVLKQKSIREEVVHESLADLDLEEVGANDPAEEPVERKVVALGASQPAMESQSFAWPTRIAVCVLVLLQLLFLPGGRQIPQTPGSRTSTFAGANSQPSTIQVAAAAPADNPGYSVAVAHDEPMPTTESAPGASTDEASKIRKAFSSATTEKSVQFLRQDVQRTSDPAKLWAEVRADNSDAEVDLARLYLEGTTVPQNCAQAKVLLQAAARKGNARVADLLNDFGDGAADVDHRCDTSVDALSISAELDSRLKNGHE
jgi:general secretion pathway protein A